MHHVRSRARSFLRPFLFALPAALLVLFGAQLLADPADAAGTANAADAQPRAVSPRGALLPDEAAVVRLFEETAPSVAYITTESVQRNALGGAEVSQGAGSGFVWDNAGHVVTNFHVVDAARRVYV